ncbi:Zn-dependent exopeptidase M28 [Candidatus Thorarchaeota archaeon]|nr:MAG: Zn-dependent exopeptidase M28 [Candidatus Thorarchaeota archaeon]
MKKQVCMVIICLALLVSSIGIVQIPTQSGLIRESTQSILSIALPLERVYGQDLSQEIWSDITETSFENYVRIVTENGSRWIADPDHYSEQNAEAREYFAEELSRISNGRIEVEIIGQYQSVVGKLPGYFAVDAPALMIGGHIDSVREAPGANDDGTGIAAALEIARVMSQYQWPLDIYFGAWNAEEIGLRGSREVADEFRTRDIELLVYYNVDMLLVPDPDDRTVLMVYPEDFYQTGQYWADLTVQMSKNYGNDIIEPVISTEFGAWTRSDHISFIQNGFSSSLFAAESGGNNDVWYHQSTDIWNNPAYDYAVATEAIKSIGAAFAFTQARAYQMPTTHDISFNLQPDQERSFHMTITKETIINVTSRWWSGGATYRILNPQGTLIEEVVFDNSSPWESSLVLNPFVSGQGIYELNVYNHRGTTTGIELSVSYESDVDSSGTYDSHEFWFDVSLFSSDQDSDTLPDAYEMILGTNWNSADSDLDLLPDNWEIEYGLDPLNPSDAIDDQDGDSLTSLEEFEYGSHPFLVDSDNDKIPDRWEIDNGLNPSFDDASEDPDNDQVSNLDEYLAGTDPNVPNAVPLEVIIPSAILSGSIIALVVVSLFVFRKR